jgi:hypothetical protein
MVPEAIDRLSPGIIYIFLQLDSRLSMFSSHTRNRVQKMPGQQLHESVPRPGCILFLPPKDEITLDLEGEHGLPQTRAFNHPVVILSKGKTKSRVAILIVYAITTSPSQVALTEDLLIASPMQ